jgi:hypothetical protein
MGSTCSIESEALPVPLKKERMKLLYYNEKH